mmetsp:Transcript_12706/g.22970  ORF Transcript_12706/g.22970 Transcript_12706/m.22970 type:complete len:84 (+) Transcript_12706:1067-1318(+)
MALKTNCCDTPPLVLSTGLMAPSLRLPRFEVAGTSGIGYGCSPLGCAALGTAAMPCQTWSMTLILLTPVRWHRVLEGSQQDQE